MALKALSRGQNLAVLVVAVGTFAAAGVAAAPHWVQEASGADMDAAFPGRAAASGLTSGMARLDCDVRQDGSLTACRVSEERPPGMGFGEAALSVAHLFRLAPQTGKPGPADLVLQWWKRR